MLYKKRVMCKNRFFNADEMGLFCKDVGKVPHIMQMAFWLIKML